MNKKLKLKIFNQKIFNDINAEDIQRLSILNVEFLAVTVAKY